MLGATIISVFADSHFLDDKWVGWWDGVEEVGELHIAKNITIVESPKNLKRSAFTSFNEAWLNIYLRLIVLTRPKRRNGHHFGDCKIRPNFVRHSTQGLPELDIRLICGCRPPIFDRYYRNESTGIFEHGDIGGSRVDVGAGLSLPYVPANAVGLSRGVNGIVGRVGLAKPDFAGVIGHLLGSQKGSPDIVDTESGNNGRQGSSYQHQERPPGHSPLGYKIALSAFMLIGGFYYANYAFRLGDTVKPSAGVAYLLLGMASVGVGIGLILTKLFPY